MGISNAATNDEHFDPEVEDSVIRILLAKPGAKAFIACLEKYGRMEEKGAQKLADDFFWNMSRRYTPFGYLRADAEFQQKAINYFIRNSPYGYECYYPLTKATEKVAITAEEALSFTNRLKDEKYLKDSDILAIAFDFFWFLQEKGTTLDNFLARSEKFKAGKIREFLAGACTEEKVGKFLNALERTRKVRQGMKQFKANLEQALGKKEGRGIYAKLAWAIETTRHSNWAYSGRRLISPNARDYILELMEEQYASNAKKHHYTYETDPTVESLFEILMDSSDIMQWNFMKALLYDSNKANATQKVEKGWVEITITRLPSGEYSQEKHEAIFNALNSMKESTKKVREAQRVLSTLSETAKLSAGKGYKDMISSSINARKTKANGTQGIQNSAGAKRIIK